MRHKDDNTLIFNLSAGELRELITQAVDERLRHAPQPQAEAQTKSDTKDWLRGGKAIQDYLGISKSTFNRLRDEEPEFDRAIIQYRGMLWAEPAKLREACNRIAQR